MKQGSQPSGAASAEPMLDFGAEGATASPTSPRSLTSLKCMV